MKITGNPFRWLWSDFLRPIFKSAGLFLGLVKPRRVLDRNRIRVIIAGGYGYGNVGDEAQLAANLQLWNKFAPGCRLTVLTPNPDYTESVHGPIKTELASRISVFGKGKWEYFGSEKVFKRKFLPVSLLCLFNVMLVRAGLPILGLPACRARLLDELNRSDVLFLSGGGYLTGMTLTRLWDHMLLIAMAHRLGIPVIMSGQTIGVFKDRASRLLARWGLKQADLIYLRDHVSSPKDLADLGIPDAKITCTFDDALFFRAATRKRVDELLARSGVDPNQPYIVVNAHYWGQKEESSRVIMQKVAKALDKIQRETGLQIVFVPMIKTDEDAIEEVRNAMVVESSMPKYDYRPDMAVGIIQRARLCVTMKHHPIVFALAAAVPVVALAFDDYYRHKNFGALKIFNQERCLIGDNLELLDRDIENLVDTILVDGAQIKCTLQQTADKLKERAGEVIGKFLKNQLD